MKRITIVAFVITLVAVTAFSESKSKKTAAPKQAAVKQVTSTPVPLAALFPPSDDMQSVTDAKGMVSMNAPNHDVVMVRVNADGTRSHACVNNETSARAFMGSQKASAAHVNPEK